jgi:D-amino-acid dehydrogenase
MTRDLAVVGGGIVGAAAALRAASVGASVVLYDRSDRGRATDAGAGIIGPALNTRDRQPQFDLAAAAAGAYPDLIADLGRRLRGPATEGGGGARGTAVDTGYERVGLLAIAVDSDEIGPFERVEHRVLARIQHQGHPTGHEVVQVAPDEARRLHPALGEVKRALLDTGAARVDGRRLLAALVAAGEAAGVEIRAASIDSLASVTAEADTVLVAGGAWSPRFGDELGVTIPVQPQRGQIAHLATPSELGDTASWPMLSLLSDQYQVGWPGGRVAVGATREDGSGFAPHTTAFGVRAVLDEALRAAPGLADAELIEVRVGLRPVTPDLMPVIGRVPGQPDVVVVTGHGPTGLTTGPFSGRLAADLALGRSVDHDLVPFALDRSFA